MRVPVFLTLTGERDEYGEKVVTGAWRYETTYWSSDVKQLKSVEGEEEPSEKDHRAKQYTEMVGGSQHAGGYSCTPGIDQASVISE